MMTETATVYQISERLPAVKADTDNGWYKIANDLSAKMCSIKLSDQEWRVFHAVEHLTFRYRKSMDWLAAGQISELTGIPQNKISEIKKRLVDRKILKIDGRMIGINTLLSEWLDKPVTPKQGKKAVPLNKGKKTPVQDLETPEQGNKNPQTGVHHKNTLLPEEDKRKRTVVFPDQAAAFSRFWSHYPNKVSKAKAETIFTKLNPDNNLLDIMINALLAQIEHRVQAEAVNQWMPNWKNPSTWLNGKCWEDELEPISTTARNHKPGVFIPNNTDTSWADGFDPFAPETFS